MSDMSNVRSVNSEDDFKIVSYKNKKRNKQNHKNNHINTNLHSNTENHVDELSTLRKINVAKEEIFTSDLYSSTTASLRESLERLDNPSILEIICLGLGRIGESMISRYQLALLLCIRDKYSVRVSIYDPQFSETDKKVLHTLDCIVLTENCEGKYKILNKKYTTIFYLPHCPKQLTNNLIWSNWGVQLAECIIISNSFNKIKETHPQRILLDAAECLLNVLPYTEEFAIINTFKYYEIFNDLAIHIFPYEKLKILTPEFWESCREPKYLEDIEFITNSLSRI